MLSLTPASSDDYEFLFSIEPPTPCDFAAWCAMLQQPQWATYMVTRGTKAVGGLWLEKVDAHTVEFHYSVVRKAVKPHESARLLLAVADCLFSDGIEVAQTVIPVSNRAAIRLANACGMIFDSYVIRDHQPFIRHILPRAFYEQHLSQWKIAYGFQNTRRAGSLPAKHDKHI